MNLLVRCRYNATEEGGGDPSQWDKYVDELTNATNQYNQNMLNLKIAAPCDDNFSDDELTYLPFFA